MADRYTAGTPDAVPADATYDEIWSNPPIRIGKAALHELLLTWLPRLAPGGRAVMVVGKNLGADSLQRWLGEQGFPTGRLASAKGFRVLESAAGAARHVTRCHRIWCAAAARTRCDDRALQAGRAAQQQAVAVGWGSAVEVPQQAASDVVGAEPKVSLSARTV